MFWNQNASLIVWEYSIYRNCAIISWYPSKYIAFTGFVTCLSGFMLEIWNHCNGANELLGICLFIWKIAWISWLVNTWSSQLVRFFERKTKFAQLKSALIKFSNKTHGIRGNLPKNPLFLVCFQNHTIAKSALIETALSGDSM